MDKKMRGNITNKYSFKLTDRCIPYEIGQQLLELDICKCMFNSTTNDIEWGNKFKIAKKTREKNKTILEIDNAIKEKKSKKELKSIIRNSCIKMSIKTKFCLLYLRCFHLNLEEREGYINKIKEIDDYLIRNSNYEYSQLEMEKKFVGSSNSVIGSYVRIGLMPLMCVLDNNDRIQIDIDAVIHKNGTCVISFTRPIFFNFKEKCFEKFEPDGVIRVKNTKYISGLFSKREEKSMKIVKEGDYEWVEDNYNEKIILEIFFQRYKDKLINQIIGKKRKSKKNIDTDLYHRHTTFFFEINAINKKNFISENINEVNEIINLCSANIDKQKQNLENIKKMDMAVNNEELMFSDRRGTKIIIIKNDKKRKDFGEEIYRHSFVLNNVLCQLVSLRDISRSIEREDISFDLLYIEKKYMFNIYKELEIFEFLDKKSEEYYKKYSKTIQLNEVRKITKEQMVIISDVIKSRKMRDDSKRNAIIQYCMIMVTILVGIPNLSNLFKNNILKNQNNEVKIIILVIIILIIILFPVYILKIKRKSIEK